MCGIIGYFGKREVVPLLINGLKKLEYRGYDSAGICVIENKKLILIKKEGKISNLEGDLSLNKINGNLGIGHTRWATHGEPNKVNAHPHLDCTGKIAIVHNGIIENYNSLKNILKKEGHKIISDTDSEVISHLIEKFYSGNLEEAFLKTLNLIEGSFGIVAIHQDEDKIVIARRSSPLIIGIGEGETFISSDVVGILNYTKRVVYLRDNEMAVINKEGYLVKDLNGDKVNNKIHEIKWKMEEIEKGNFKHFTLKEIFEQPQAIENLLRGRVKEDTVKLSLDFDFANIKRIVIVACGTSWHSALMGKHIFENILRIPVEVDYASEFRYRNPIVGKDDLVIVISQSGETADTLAALKEAKAKNAKTLGIINVVGSTISREVDLGMYLHAGPEIGVASTKAFTSQIIALYLIALFIKQETKFLDENNKELLREICKLPGKIKVVLDGKDKIKEIAEKFKDYKDFLYLGRGINFPVALEGALKLKEISYIHAEGYPAAEIKHGPIAMIDENMPVVFVISKDKHSKVLSSMEEVKARKGKIIVITDENDENISKITKDVFEVPSTKEELVSFLNSIVLQLLAYYIADSKGINVDQPRNLAKSVTVE